MASTITILDASREFTKVEKYLMTLDPNITSVKDIEDGTVIVVDGFLEFEDRKEDSTVSEIMSIITPERKVYSCQSTTFKASVKQIADLMEGEQFAVVKTSGVTKNNRDYINCYLDVNSVTE